MMIQKQGITLFLTAVTLFIASTFNTVILARISSNARNDSYPLFSTLDPQDYLHQREKNRLKDISEDDTLDNPWFGFSISPFGQKADCAKNSCNNQIEIGDLYGKWSMIGLIFGDKPNDTSQNRPILDMVKSSTNLFFDNQGTTSLTIKDSENVVSDPLLIDKEEKCGFFSVPMKYKKRGIRFDLKAHITDDVGISVNFGLADICQEPTFKNQGPTTPTSTTDNKVSINNCIKIDKCVLNEKLMCNLKNVSKEICLNLDPFHKFSIEDLRAGLYWRHAFPINHDNNYWEDFSLIPFIHFEGGIAVGTDRDYNQAAALSFGSNDHHSIGLSTGLNVDFTQTIEIGGEVGFTHFFDKDICKMPVPTSLCQSGIYPYTADVNRDPGTNWHFGLKMAAYHFIGDLSFYFQYILVEHQPDKITLKEPDSAFKPELLEKLSSWKNQMANIGFNYDISPHISLGFFWQAPLPQYNVYRSTTVMVSFNATY